MRKQLILLSQASALLAFFLMLCSGPAWGSNASAGEVNEMPNDAQVTTQPAESEIRGVVTDSKTGEPLIGCAVILKGTKTGVMTDNDGEFVINAKEGDVLEFSLIGYVGKSIEIGKAKIITVTLVEDAEKLEEVVVTAFGTGQKKESVTGAIQSVRPSDLVVPSANLSNSFAGRLAGVVAYQRSGEPGSNGSNFYIRGISTLSGVTNPLIIMDGVEISNADLNAIDPEIIDSFSILKDATATAMYGTRGANGVMIIKTKSGTDTEKPIIGFRVETYVNVPTKIPEFVDGVTYMKMYNEAVTNQGTGSVLFTQAQMDGVANGTDPYIYPNVDWYGEIFRDYTFNQKANFNVRGGTEKITYFMNLSANHETGMLQDNSSKYFSFNNNINLKKFTFQNNIDFNMTKSSKIGLRLNVQLNDYRGPYRTVNEIFNQIMNNNPVDYPISFPNSFLADGEWVHWGSYSGGNEQGAQNPMAYATQGYSDYTESTVIANVDFDQKLDFITEGLSFKALFSFKNWSYTRTNRVQGYNKYFLSDYSLNDDGTYNYTITAMGVPSRHSMETSNSTNGDRKFYFQTYFDYTRSFGNHNVNGMLLWNIEQYNTNVPSSLITSLPQRRMGFAARVMYDFKRRYLMEFNAGYNGSENFAKGHRWGFFPSVSVGWNISEEKFWEPIKPVVSHLKIRGSYGLVGNDRTNYDRFLYLAQVNLTGSSSYTTGYGNTLVSYSGPTYTRFQNNDISWEIGRKLNIGMDLELFKSLNITAEFFREIRSDIFQTKTSIPKYFGTGNTTLYGNLAKVKNWGTDISVDYGKQFGRDLSIQFKGTFTFARNKVLEYDEGAGTIPAISRIGKSVNAIWGYIDDGLYIDEADIENNPTSTLSNIGIAPGDIKYIDQPDENGEYDGMITSDDRVVIGYPTVPEIVYGFGPSIVYKNWDFSFFFQGQANVSLMMSDFAPFGASYNRNVLKWVADDYWSPSNQNPDAKFPRLTQYVNNNNTASSTFWLRNASFLKLKNIELGYSYKKARIYVSGLNVLTISPFKHWDPEMGGGKGLTYPTQRTFNVGIQITL